MSKTYSLNFFVETVKLLRKRKRFIKSIRFLSRTIKQDLIQSQNNSLPLNLSLTRKSLGLKFFNNRIKHKVRNRLYRLIKKNQKGRKRYKLFWRKRKLRAKTLRKRLKSPLTPLSQLPLHTYLVRPRR
jgi:hypothetical protein